MGIFHWNIFFCVSKLSIDLFFKLPVNKYLAINIEGNIGQLTVIRTSSFISHLKCRNTDSRKTFNEIILSCRVDYIYITRESWSGDHRYPRIPNFEWGNGRNETCHFMAFKNLQILVIDSVVNCLLLAKLI